MRTGIRQVVRVGVCGVLGCLAIVAILGLPEFVEYVESASHVPANSVTQPIIIALGPAPWWARHPNTLRGLPALSVILTALLWSFLRSNRRDSLQNHGLTKIGPHDA
jgi:hypothetical protein